MDRSKYNLRKVSSRVADLHASVEEELSVLRSQVAQVKSQVQTDVAVIPKATESAIESPDVTNNCNILINKIELLHEKLNAEIQIIKCDIDKALDQLNYAVESQIQKTYNRNVIVYGLQEQGEKNIYESARELFSSKVGCQVEKSDISFCYRMGNKVNGKIRPLVVEFVNKWKRDEVFSNKSKLKGTKIMIVEMLTKSRIELFSMVRKKYGHKCWTHNGEVFISNDTKVIRVKDKQSFDKYIAI